MTNPEHETTHQQTLYAPDEQQQRREFDLLLSGWLQAHQARPTIHGERGRFDVETIVADAAAALERGSSPYIALLLNIAPQFLSPEDRELEVLEVGDE